VCQWWGATRCTGYLHAFFGVGLDDQIVVNQLFASVAIILQAAVTAALCMRRGTQMIHQCVSFVAVICMILSVATVMAVPRRIFDVCVAAISPSASVSYYMNLGGERGRCNFSSIYSPV
jgi:hypothetical protein